MSKMTKIDEGQHFILYLLEFSSGSQNFSFRDKVDKVTSIPYINVEDIIAALGSDKTLHDYVSSNRGLDFINELLRNNPGMKFTDLLL